MQTNCAECGDKRCGCNRDGQQAFSAAKQADAPTPADVRAYLARQNRWVMWQLRLSALVEVL